MKLDNIIEKSFLYTQQQQNLGEKATYIPELALVDENLLGVSVFTSEGELLNKGDAQQQFSVQSIIKVLSLVVAYDHLEKKLWDRVGVEPSGTSFNSMILLELEKGIPRNPFINAGAIVIADVLLDCLQNPEKDFLNFVQSLSKDTSITYHDAIYESEKSVAYRNYALVHLMKSFGNIKNDIDKVMDFYFRICSITMSCQQLAKTFSFLMKDGFCYTNKKQILSFSKTKRINAIMQLCGFYDEAGEFAYRVGLPGKSGVGGGIIAIHPGKYSIATYSPKLNVKGNSYRGMIFLEKFTSSIASSVF